jgi:hypothetical protein
VPLVYPFYMTLREWGPLPQEWQAPLIRAQMEILS